MPHWDTADSDFDLVRRGAAYYDGLLDGLPDAAFAEPSALPDWTRGHVVAHVALNALALTRLVHWAATGVETPMYASPEARNTDIAAHAGWPPPDLRRLHRDATATLAAAWREIPRDRWAAPVSTNTAAGLPGYETVWMRVKELWLHAIDLGAGGAWDDVPAEFVDRLLADTVALWVSRGQCAGLVLAPSDRADPITVAGDGTTVTASGSAADLARWATGRGDAGVSSSAPVDVPRWR